MSRELRNIGTFVHARLLQLARFEQSDYQVRPARCARERLLYRPSVCDQREQFVLNGAMLFAICQDNPFRPSLTLDVPGRGDPDPATGADGIRSICSVDVPDDGVAFYIVDVKPLRSAAKTIPRCACQNRRNNRRIATDLMFRTVMVTRARPTMFFHSGRS